MDCEQLKIYPLYLAMSMMQIKNILWYCLVLHWWLKSKKGQSPVSVRVWETEFLRSLSELTDQVNEIIPRCKPLKFEIFLVTNILVKEYFLF